MSKTLNAGVCVMRKKNPWLAAILNFLFPGIGFAYLGSVPLIIAGIVLFISYVVIEIIYYKHTVGMADQPSYWIFSIESLTLLFHHS